MDFTKIYYVGICILAFLFAWLAEKTDKKLFIIISGVILTLYSGLRGISVGIDTESYYIYFIRIKNGLDVAINERPFIEAVRFLLRFFNNPSAIVFIISAVTIGFFFASFWKLRDEFSLSWMVLIFLCLYHARSMNIIRQFLAWSIIFFGLTFLLKNKYLKCAICFIIATSFHLSSMISFAVLGVYIIFEDKRRSRLGMIVLLLGLFGGAYYGGIFEEVERAYTRYYVFSDAQIGFMSIYKTIVLFGIVIFERNNISIRFTRKVTEDVGSRIDNRSYIDYKIVFFYFIAILFEAVSYFSMYSSRAGLPLLSFDFLFWGKLLKNRTDTEVYKAALLMMLLYIYVNNLIGNGYGVFPYTTIFN